MEYGPFFFPFNYHCYKDLHDGHHTEQAQMLTGHIVKTKYGGPHFRTGGAHSVPIISERNIQGNNNDI